MRKMCGLCKGGAIDNPWYHPARGDSRVTYKVCLGCRKREEVKWVFGLYADGMWCVESSDLIGHEHGCGDLSYHPRCHKKAFERRSCVDD